MNSPVITNDKGNDSGNTDEIPSLLIPMADKVKLLLPTVSVAEMIPYKKPEATQLDTSSEKPSWYLGGLYWRGNEVPMVSFEMLNGGEMPKLVPSSQILILNNTGVNSKLPFLCMPTQGIPRLSRVASDEIFENNQVPLKLYEQMHVHISGETAVIPDVSKLEEICAAMLGFSY